MAKKKMSPRAAEARHETEPEGQKLGDYLSSIRGIRRMTLREVEEASQGEVSNAYLSQLEKNKISRPSPNILRALAQVYVVPYEALMERAGYFSPTVAAQSYDALRSASPAPAGYGSLLAAANLTDEEEESLLEYLAFLRARKAKSKKA